MQGHLSYQECVGDDPAKKILVLFLSIFSPSHSVSFLRAISKPSIISISSNLASPSSNEPYLYIQIMLTNPLRLRLRLVSFYSILLVLITILTCDTDSVIPVE